MSTWIQRLRQKPQAVRERMLMVTLVIAAPVLLGIGTLVFMHERSGRTYEQVISAKNLSAYFSGTFSQFKEAKSSFKSTVRQGDSVATQ